MRDMMELDGIGDVGSLFGIAGLKEDLMDVAIMGASAGAAVVAGELAFTKISFLAGQRPWVKALIAVGAGAAAGIALGRYANKAIGAGVAAGLVGWGVAAGIKSVAGPTLGLGQMDYSGNDLLLGLGGDELSVRDWRPIPGQTNGLGQGVGPVEARNLTQIPGGGYIAGVEAFLS